MERLCKIYNKKYCIPIYSGTLAIEGLLRILKKDKCDKVLISSISCYSILEAVLNAGLIPVLATPANGILFSIDELKDIIKKENIKIYIAVHQYGYYQEIPKMDDLVIIEDLSQAWNIKYKDETIKYKGDYLIQSLGKSKPLCNKVGGLILSNRDISIFFDLKVRKNRMQSNILLEYYYPLKINYKKLIFKANIKIHKQRLNAKMFNNIFKRYNSIEIFSNGEYIPSYHRYVVMVDCKDKELFVNILNKSKINYELEYSKKLDKLPVSLNNNVKILKSNNQNMKNNIVVLLKTNNNILNIIKLKKELEWYYER